MTSQSVYSYYANKFVFPEFSYNQGNIQLHCPQGYIGWADLYNIYDLDKDLKGNLRKAPKIYYQTLHPGNNKQNVPLALALFHDTTIVTTKNYYPNREDVSGFLNALHTWWTLVNSKQRYTANLLFFFNEYDIHNKKTKNILQTTQP